MGLVLGKITVETPKYELLESKPNYEIRKYPPHVVAEVTYNPSDMNGNRDGGFSLLAKYIGAIGKPQNSRPENIGMTAPVITTRTGNQPEKIDMTSPVITKETKNEKVTMQFILPAKYSKVKDAPKPLDERVVIREEGENKFGVVKFSGVANDQVVNEKVDKLKMSLERDGYKVIGDYLLARYNPPWTLPMYRTNEVMIPIE